MNPLDEASFDSLAEQALHELDAAVSADEELEVGLAMGVLTIQFPDRARYIINSHRAARQIWMAAGARAWHFDWTGSSWVAAKTDEELWATVDGLLKAKGARGIR
jgi:CyaY protein